MRKLIKGSFIFAFFVASLIAYGQAPTYTPNYGFQIPGYGTSNWQVPLDYNFERLDSILSGSISVGTGISTWAPQTTYQVGQLILYNGQGYVSLVNGNTNNIPTNASFWTNNLSPISSGTSSGSLTTQTIPVASGPSSLTNSALTDNGTNLTYTPAAGGGFTVNGFIGSTGTAYLTNVQTGGVVTGTLLSSGPITTSIINNGVPGTPITMNQYGGGTVALSLTNGLQINGGLSLNGNFGTAGQCLASAGSATLPTWTTCGSGGGGSLTYPGIVYATSSTTNSIATSPQLVSALNTSPSTTLASALIPILNQSTTGNAATATTAASVNANNYPASGSFVSGGIPYFSGVSQVSSSALLPANGVVVGAGAGAAPHSILVDNSVGHVLLATAGDPAFGPIPNNTANTTGSAGSLSTASALPNGMTATTQTTGDSSTDVATDAFVIANASGGGSSPIFIHTLSGASPTIAVHSTSVPALETFYLPMTANVTSITLPANTAVADGEIFTITVSQPATGGPYTVAAGTANSFLNPGSGTTLVNSVPGGCPNIGTTVSSTAPSQLLLSAVYKASLTQYQVLGCQTIPAQTGVTEASLSVLSGQYGNYGSNTVLVSTTAVNAGHFANISINNTNGAACTTPPIINVFDGPTNIGTGVSASTSIQARGVATTGAESLTFAAGDVIGVYVQTTGSSCPTFFGITAQYVEP